MDIQASLWPTAVWVTLGEWDYQIPAEPASVWIRAIADPDGGAIVPGLLEPEDQRQVWRDLVMGRLEREVVNEAWRAVVGAASGRPWWEASRLVLSATSRENWGFIHGRLMTRGVDLDRFSLGGFCNIVHVMALEACKDESERSRYEFELTTPPDGVEPEDAHEATDAAEDFLAAMRQFQHVAPVGPAHGEGGPAREAGGPAREVR